MRNITTLAVSIWLCIASVAGYAVADTSDGPVICNPDAGPTHSILSSEIRTETLQDAYKNQRPNMADQKVIDSRIDLGRHRSVFVKNELKALDGRLRYFAVLQDRFTRTYPEEIVAPLSSLICLLGRLDGLLLSDGIAHHYVMVDQVDLQTGVIRIYDGWPEQSFLIGPDLPLQSRGKLIQLENGTTIEAPLLAVSKFIVGATFLDGENFAKRLRAVTNLDADPKNLIALGISMFREGKLESFNAAIGYLRLATKVAQGLNDDAARTLANQELAFVLMASALTGAPKIPRKVAEGYIKEGEKIITHEKLSLNKLSAERQVKLASIFRERGQLGQAYEFASGAIALNAQRDDAFAERASILIAAEKYDQALGDAEEAYRLNTARIRSIIKVPGEDFLKYYYESGSNGMTIVKDINNERMYILECLADIYSHKNQYQKMLETGIEGEKVNRSSLFGLMVRAEAEFGLGRRKEARALADEALKRATDTGFVRARLKEIFDAPL